MSANEIITQCEAIATRQYPGDEMADKLARAEYLCTLLRQKLRELMFKVVA